MSKIGNGKTVNDILGIDIHNGDEVLFCNPKNNKLTRGVVIHKVNTYDKFVDIKYLEDIFTDKGLQIEERFSQVTSDQIVNISIIKDAAPQYFI